MTFGLRGWDNELRSQHPVAHPNAISAASAGGNVFHLPKLVTAALRFMSCLFSPLAGLYDGRHGQRR